MQRNYEEPGSGIPEHYFPAHKKAAEAAFYYLPEYPNPRITTRAFALVQPSLLALAR
jgi:hypothetical protein